MSHYSLLVLNYSGEDELANRMEPYDEALEAELHICQSRSELLKNYYLYEYFDAYIAYLKNYYSFDMNNNLLSTCNPEARWDYYDVICSGRIKDFNDWEPKIFSADEINALRQRFEGLNYEETTNIACIGLTPGEYVVKMSSGRSTYAVLTESGEWIEPGAVGSFGTSTASANDRMKWSLNFYSRFIKDLDPETRIAFVDVHI